MWDPGGKGLQTDIMVSGNISYMIQGLVLGKQSALLTR